MPSFVYVEPSETNLTNAAARCACGLVDYVEWSVNKTEYKGGEGREFPPQYNTAEFCISKND